MGEDTTVARYAQSYPVAIVGCGPVGMTTALELARHGVGCVVLEAEPQLSEAGSRAIALAAHTLRAWQRLGAAEPILQRGLRLTRSHIYHRESEIVRVEHPVEQGIPSWLILQQTHTEAALFEALETSPLITVDFGRRVTGLTQHTEGVRLETNGGPLQARYVVGCDGAHSTVQRLVELSPEGWTCGDRFIIADIRLATPWPQERHLWFDPTSNPGRQILAVPQPDGQWRIDWQVPVGTRADAERASGALRERIRALVGHDEYELDWLSDYRFHQRVVPSFRAGRVFLAGDAAHLMAPFGARGLNSGVEDAVNIGWKLALVLTGVAPAVLLDSYDRERRAAALTNLAATGAVARFMAPSNPPGRWRRAAILSASHHSRWALRYVRGNSFATPAVYESGGHLLVGRPLPVDVELPRRALTALSARPMLVSRALGGLRVELAPRPAGLNIDTDRVLLLRPDGYVAAVVPADAGTIRAAVHLALTGKFHV
jgi:2-polyprenyl-6-methoxyphenol hydroxylase-like FAD-dependent oxidoreductase